MSLCQLNLLKALCFIARSFIAVNSTLLYAQGMSKNIVQVNFRMPEDLKNRLEAATHVSKRTLTAEIVARLEASFVIENIRKLDPESFDEIVQSPYNPIMGPEIKLLIEATIDRTIRRLGLIKDDDKKSEDVATNERSSPAPRPKRQIQL